MLRQARYAATFRCRYAGNDRRLIFDYAFVAERAAGNMLVRNSGSGGEGAHDCRPRGRHQRSKHAWCWAAAAVVGLILGSVLLSAAPLDRPRRLPVLARKGPRTSYPPRGPATHRHGRSAAALLTPGAGDCAALLKRQRVLLHDLDDGGIFLIISPAVSLSLFAEGANNPQRTPREERVPHSSSHRRDPCPGRDNLSDYRRPAVDRVRPACTSTPSILQIVVLASFPDAVTNVYVAVLRECGEAGSRPPQSGDGLSARSLCRGRFCPYVGSDCGRVGVPRDRAERLPRRSPRVASSTDRRWSTPEPQDSGENI